MRRALQWTVVLTVSVLASIAATAAGAGAGPGPAAAAVQPAGDSALTLTPPVPPGAWPNRWRSYVDWYLQEPDWSPRGRVVVDSGFRSNPHGFGFFNTGRPDWTNHDIFGTPLSGPENLDADTLRSMMGPRVCVEAMMSGPCTLTLAARQWMRNTNAAMSGGHCFGLAASAQQLFQGDLRASRFQAGADTAYDLRLRTPISRQIARDMAAQFTLGVAQFTIGPRRAIPRLLNRISRGEVPYILAMWFGVGGHAVTPFAVRSRGDGRYDVSVYDNNYPGFSRAVRINTVRGTARYHLMDNAFGRPITRVLSMALIPVAQVAARQRCPFCPGALNTSVQLRPVHSDVPIRTQITDLQGRRIPGVRETRPLEPWRPGERWEFPSYEVPAGQPFVVTVNAERRAAPVDTTMTATSGQFVIGITDARIAAGSVGHVGVDPRDGTLVYRSDNPALGPLRFVDTLPSTSTQVVARTVSGRTRGVAGGMKEDRKIVSLATVDDQSGLVGVSARHSYVDGSGAPALLRARVMATIPAGGRLIVDYSNWSRQHPRALRAHVLSHGVRTEIPVTFRF